MSNTRVKLNCACEFKEILKKLSVRTSLGLYRSHVIRAHSSWASQKYNLPWDLGTSEALETSVLDFLARRIQLCRDPSLIGHFLSISSKKMPRKWSLGPRTSNAPQRELFVCGFRSFVALLVLQQINFWVSVSDGRSSCSTKQQFLEKLSKICKQKLCRYTVVICVRYSDSVKTSV